MSWKKLPREIDKHLGIDPTKCICKGCGCNTLLHGCFCEDVNIQTDIYNAIRGCCISDESATEATKKAFEAIKDRLNKRSNK